MNNMLNLNEVRRIISEVSESGSLDEKLGYLKATDPLLGLIFESVPDEITALKNAVLILAEHNKKVGTVLSPEESKRVFELHGLGHKPKEIANMLRRSQSVVMDHLRRGVPKDKPTVRQVIEEEIKASMTLSELSQIVFNRTGRIVSKRSLTKQLYTYLKVSVVKDCVTLPLIKND